MHKQTITLILFILNVLFNSVSYATNSDWIKGTILNGVTQTDIISKGLDDEKTLGIILPGSSCVAEANAKLFPTGRIHISINAMKCRNGVTHERTEMYGYVFDPRSKETGMISECLETEIGPHGTFGGCIKAKLNAKTPVSIHLTYIVKQKQ